MKYKLLLILLFFSVQQAASAQVLVSKLLGKGAADFGLGYGIFTYFDIPRPAENQSFRIELLDLAFYAKKGESLFTSTESARAHLSTRLGYKYVFSETSAGFFVLPSAGYCQTFFIEPGQSTVKGNGIAAALETGYALEVGQNENKLNFSIKYEYDHGGADLVLQSVAFKFSYAFGVFRRREY